MTEDCLVAGQRFAVMHQAATRPHAPERSRAQLVLRALTAVLDDAVSGADVVQQEISERMDPLVTQRRRHRELAAVDDGPCGGRRYRSNVADVAADLIEETRALLRVEGGRELFVARRRFRRAHEARECLDVVAVLRFGHLVESSYGSSECRVLG